jgi:ABC-2 type transport system ATP-binding protein
VSLALGVSALSKHFGSGAELGRRALAEVSFSAQAGETIAVLGPNGAGKTTLLSILAGLQSASSGSVECPAGEVGWAPQEPALYSKLSVAENLELFARLEGIAEPRSAVARMLSQTGLSERAKDRLGELSGGNRQRVNVALALIADPPVLALDEPTASLDPAQRERLWSFLGELVQAGRTVLFSTHNPSEAQRHADRVLVLRGGRLLFEGTPAQLVAEIGERAEGDLERALVLFLAEHGEGVEE